MSSNKLTIEGITLEKTTKGFQLIVPTSANVLTIKDWKEKHEKSIKKFKRDNR